MHPNTGYPSGKAVIEFSNSTELEAAIAGMNGGQIDGNIIECSISKFPTPLIKLHREPKRRIFGNSRGRAPRRGGDHYAPMRRDLSRSPMRRRSFSRSRSPVRRRREYSRSPARHSPGRRSPRQPIRLRRPSRSPPRRYSRSPIRRPSRSPQVRRPSRSRSPIRRHSRSPIRSRSPVRRYSRSPRNRGPARRRSPSYSRSRSPARSPRFNRRYTPSPRRFSPRRRSPSRSPAPISRMNY